MRNQSTKYESWDVKTKLLELWQHTKKVFDKKNACDLDLWQNGLKNYRYSRLIHVLQMYTHTYVYISKTLSKKTIRFIAAQWKCGLTDRPGAYYRPATKSGVLIRPWTLWTTLVFWWKETSMVRWLRKQIVFVHVFLLR